MKNQRLAVQAAALQKNPAEAEVILRMSVIANAITAIGRTFDRPSSEMISATDQRDMVCRWILVASYLNGLSSSSTNDTMALLGSWQRLVSRAASLCRRQCRWTR
jgi:hypothetical protein